MTPMGKFIALVASIAVFVMPATTMPLHCILEAPTENHPPCHMVMGMSPSADQINAGPSDHSCCRVSASKPESISVPQSSSGKGIFVPSTTNSLLADLPAASAMHERFDWPVQSPGGPALAVLCTFLI